MMKKSRPAEERQKAMDKKPIARGGTPHLAGKTAERKQSGN